MTALPRIQYFLGANAPGGFYSLYSELLSPDRAQAIYILKGGPGCGKSTLMRRVGARMEEEELATEYILCSGDPDSLDAVVLPQLRVALVDGTAPHAGVPQGHPSGNRMPPGLPLWYNRQRFFFQTQFTKSCFPAIISKLKIL